MVATLFEAFLSLIIVGLILIVAACIALFIWACVRTFFVSKRKKGGNK